MKRRIFAMLLSLAMLFTLAPTAFAADGGSETLVTRGNCGAPNDENGEYTNTVTWSFDSTTGTLTISGNGAMANLNKSTETENISDGVGTYPWANLKDSITNIVIADGVTSIGSKAFIAYTNVTSVSIGKDVSEIGVGALSQLSACTNFNVSSQNRNFMTDETGALFDDSQKKLIAFPCGSSVEEYAIPATVTVISYGAFSRAAHLKTITIPADSSLSTIGYGAFAFTTALETVNLIPASANTIGDIPFAQSGVKHIYCADKDTKDRIQNKVNGLLVDVLLTDETAAIEFTTDTGYTYRIDDGKALLVSAPKNVATSTVPSEVTCQGAAYPVTGIWKGAFAISLDWREANSNKDKRNEVITSVDLPASVTQIGERAFYFCKKLTTITVKSTKVSIDYLAFATQNSSTSGTTVDFSAVTTLQSNGTDKWVGVKNVILNNEDQLDTIKSNVDTGAVAVIGNNKWVMGSDGNWTEQPKTNLKATVDDIIWTFDAVGGKATLKAYLPQTVESVTVPSTLTADGVTYTVTELGAGLFGWTGNYNEKDNYNTNIKNVVIPKTVTTIGEDMFRYSQNLESVTIQGESVLFKNKRTFSGTNSLNVLDMSAVKTITFDSNVTSYFSNMGSNRSPAVIYVSSSAIMSAVEAHRSSGYLTYAVTNGGTLKNPPTSNIELATPVKDGYVFDGWYENADFSGNAATTPTAGKTYYAKWTMADSISLTSNAASPVTYGTKVTLTASPVNSSWGYVWYKDVNGNGTLELSTDKQIINNKSTLELADVSDSGTYWVQVIDGSNTKTSNKVNVTITKAAGTASVSMDGWAYGETAKTPVPASATNGTENVTYQYKVANAEDSTYSPAVPTAAGSYTVKATFSATENYEKATATTNFTIAQATPTVSITAEPASLVGGGTVKLTVTTDAPAEVVPACEGVTVTKTGDGTFSALLPNETKTYTFTASYAGDDNHAEASNTCQVSVTRHTSSSSSSNPTYSVTTPSKSENGGVAVSSKNARKGDAVTVTVTPDAGYQLDKLTVTDKNGNVLKLTDKGDGKYSFTMPDGKVEVKAAFVKKVETRPFVDVSADAYYNQAVQWAQEKGITDGISSNLFGPKQPCTRSQIVTFLWRAAGSPEPKSTAAGMTDVVPGSYYAKAVAWAVENGITTGTAEGTFSPDATCTRAQAVTFLWRAAGSPTPKTKLMPFPDVPVGSYYWNAVLWAIEQGITEGTSYLTFSPNDSCTRAQIVTFLWRAKGNPAVSGSAPFTDVAPDAYYAAAVTWAEKNGITGGIGNGLFGSNNTCTRAQIVTFLYRAMK